MEKRILEALYRIEEIEKIKIIYACESGSRAWGFESKNSDYDVRFVYTRPIETYITIQERSDCIDKLNGNPQTCDLIKSYNSEKIDMCGWDISKTIYLISRRNPTFAEWMSSPIIYLNRNKAREKLSKYCLNLYKSKSGIYHYEHMARRNFNKYIKNVTGKVQLKKYLYVLRPLYACEWILQNGSPPPMVFSEIYNNKNFFKEPFLEILPEIKRLIEKKKLDELQRGPRVELLDKTCERLLDFYREYAKDISTSTTLEHKDYEELDLFLWEIIQEHSLD